MDDFKDWYGNRKGKYILFFGFYLIFFVFLAIYLRNSNTEKVEPKKEETKQEQKIATYDITNLIENDFKYEIVINDNEELITFNGSKKKTDYGEYANKYFLDIYNINQLLKRSKYISSKENILTYELTNSTLNELLSKEKPDGKNRIDVYVTKDNKVERIVLDLSSFLDKEIYQINIKYIVGDANENSSS